MFISTAIKSVVGGAEIPVLFFFPMLLGESGCLLLTLEGIKRILPAVKKEIQDFISSKKIDGIEMVFDGYRGVIVTTAFNR